MHYYLTGSYSMADEPGIKLWQFDIKDGSLTEKAFAKGVERPSYLALSPAEDVAIVCSEKENGKLISFRFELGEEMLTEVNRQPSNGDHPAHAIVDESGKWVLSVNYSSGNVNVYPLEAGGVIGNLTDSVKHEGTGPNIERQDAAHPHSVSQIPRTQLFLVPDLGMDQIRLYKLDDRLGKLTFQCAIQTAPGTGPRHIAFHPFQNVFYVVEELSSSLAVYRVEEETRIDKLQAVQLIPYTWRGQNTSAEVAVSENGEFLYASNRGHDSIAIFSITTDGTLEMLGFAATGGKGPRHFALSPGAEWLIAANENSGTLTVLKLDDQGIPVLYGEPIKTNSPVCVKYVGSL